MSESSWKDTAFSRVRELDDELALSRPLTDEAAVKVYWAVRARIQTAYVALGVTPAPPVAGEPGQQLSPIRVVGDLSDPTAFQKRRSRHPGQKAEPIWTSIHRGEEDLLLIARHEYVHLTAVRLKSQLRSDPSVQDPDADENKGFLDRYKLPPTPITDAAEAVRRAAPLAAPPPAVVVPPVVVPPTAVVVPPPPVAAAGATPDLYDPGSLEALRSILGWFNRASDQTHVSLRSFRNSLFLLGVVLVVATVGVVAVGAWLPDSVRLCTPQTAASARSEAPSISPTSAAGSAVTAALNLVPRTAASPSPGAAAQSPAVVCLYEPTDQARIDLFMVALFGAIGGLLSALVVLRGLQSFSTPYNLQLVQAMLKVPAGAVTAIVGTLAVQNGVLGALAPQKGYAVLVYAVIFGIGQQALTAALDKKADSLLNSAQQASAGGNPTVASPKRTAAAKT